jgi:hypothetical protein
MAIGWWNKNNQCRKLKLIWHKLEKFVWVLIQECIELKISDTEMTSQERNKFRARRSKHTQTFLQRGLCISCAARTLQHNIQWLQWGVTFSQVVWLIGCWLVSASHK